MSKESKKQDTKEPLHIPLSFEETLSGMLQVRPESDTKKPSPKRSATVKKTPKKAKS